MKLPKVETLIIFAFFGCVSLWAVSKCTSERADFVRDSDSDDASGERPVRRDTVVVQQPVQQPPVQSPPVNTQSPSATPPSVASPAPSTPAPQPGAKPTRPVLSNQPSPATAQPTTTQPPATTTKYSTLYVTIDGLKVRKEPGLKSETVAKLALYEPVSFLNEKTKWTQEISLGYEKVTDHWVKIRTQSGKDGWVFGAGVHYYKMKRQGVMD